MDKQGLRSILTHKIEGLVNMEDNENAEFKIFHCMQLWHHAYNLIHILPRIQSHAYTQPNMHQKYYSFCQGYNHMHTQIEVNALCRSARTIEQ